jgi:hypothetical protein
MKMPDINYEKYFVRRPILESGAGQGASIIGAGERMVVDR